MAYESGSWTNPATSAYSEITGALLEGRGIDPNTGDPIQGGGGNQLDSNWRQIYTDFDDVVWISYTEPNAGFRWIEGNGGADTILGGNGSNLIYGGDGDDLIGGGVCENILSGDVGNDSLVGNNLVDLILGGVGNDSVQGYAGSDTILGNEGNDLIEGMLGDDFMQGGAGADTLKGGGGMDFYYVDDALDTIVENVSEGEDVVVASISYSLAGLANVEHLGLIGTARNATGNSGNNILQGNELANLITGGGGTDTLAGLQGNDTYVLSGSSDSVVEYAVEGTDEIRCSFNFSLSGIANVENLTLTGTAALSGAGSSGANVLTGNSGANSLRGFGGNDILNGAAGIDSLLGGDGNDTYTVDSTTDVITEAIGDAAGIDRVNSSVSFSLSAIANIEQLVLTGTTAINGTGNTLANALYGNAAANILNGGTGADAMTGGLGNDTYYVDNADDRVAETSTLATEIDRVNSSITYALGTNLETLVLTGTAAINGTGNALANAITGNAAANILNAGAGNDTLNGGVGADTMTGGLGNDAYYVDNAGDRVTETSTLATEIDRVNSSISYALGTNLETLVLTGTAAINGTGNTLANALTGNAAANVLTGGAGRDTLTGGAGADTLTGFSGVAANGATEIDTLTGGTEADRFVLGNAAMRFYDDALAANAGRGGYALITDFTAGQDKLQLKGTAANYYLGASGVAGVTGSGLFFEQGATDELIAIVRSGNTTALTAANTITTAVFV